MHTIKFMRIYVCKQLSIKLPLIQSALLDPAFALSPLFIGISHDFPLIDYRGKRVQMIEQPITFFLHVRSCKAKLLLIPELGQNMSLF